MTESEENEFRQALRVAFAASQIVYTVFSVPVEGADALALEPFAVVQFQTGECGVVVPDRWEHDDSCKIRMQQILDEEGDRRGTLLN